MFQEILDGDERDVGVDYKGTSESPFSSETGLQ